jgi:hypothetical protein
MIALAMAAPAHGATRYAEPGGDGPATGLNACPEADPCGLEPAVENGAVANGDLVLLLPGTYSLGAASLTANRDIVIRPRDAGTRPVITGTIAGTMVSLSGGADLRDVDLNHTLVGSPSTITLFILNSPATVVERVAVTATLTSGNSHFACNAFEGLIRDSTCLVTGGSAGAFPVAVGASIGNSNATPYTPEFVNVTAWSPQNSGSGVSVMASSGVTVSASARNVIANGAGGDAIASASAGGSATLTLANSNYNSSVAINQGGTQSVTPHGSGTNQTALPLLASPNTGDFHQLTGSPTIDAGAADGALGTQDIDSQARSQGTNPDIGADEFDVPATPTINGTIPSSPAKDTSPEVKGSGAGAGSTVRVYGDSSCSGPELGSGSAATFNGANGVTASVPANVTTDLRVTATDSLGHVSACSNPFAYTEDSAPPAAPQITATDPPSPASDNNPEVRGSAEAGSTVRIFPTADCTGAPLATGAATDFAAPGLTVAVADDSTTNLRATATDAAGNASGCSGALQYVERSASTGGAGDGGGEGGGSQTVDRASPQTSVDAAPKAVVKTRKKKAPFRVAFSANELATFTCSLDGATPTGCTSPVSGKVGRGFHTFEVTATDTAGNKDPSAAKATWKVKRKKKKRRR